MEKEKVSSGADETQMKKDSMLKKDSTANKAQDAAQIS